MVLVWMFIVVLILALAAVIFSGFLPAGMAESVATLVDRILSTAGNLVGAGVVGLVTAVAALLIALLGLSGWAYGQQVPYRDRQGDLTGGQW